MAYTFFLTSSSSGLHVLLVMLEWFVRWEVNGRTTAVFCKMQLPGFVQITRSILVYFLLSFHIKCFIRVQTGIYQ